MQQEECRHEATTPHEYNYAAYQTHSQIACSDSSAFHQLQTSYLSFADSPNRTLASCHHNLRNGFTSDGVASTLSNAPSLPDR
jgi:hypothetical protein